MKIYEELAPGFTKEFLDSYRSQVEHRQRLETMTIGGDNRRANTAQWLSFALAMALLIMGFALLMLGKDVYALVALVAAIGPLITAFFAGSIIRTLERQKKAKASSGQ